MKNQRRKIGDIVLVPLSEGRYAYGMVLKEPVFGFFDLVSNSNTQLSPREISARPILFRVGVQRYAVTKGIWKVIGHLTPPASFLEPPTFFIQDEYTGALFTTMDGGTKIPATYEECEQLECCAAWDPEHVVSRLEDHFAGRPNKWVELLRPRRIPT